MKIIRKLPYRSEIQHVDVGVRREILIFVTKSVHHGDDVQSEFIKLERFDYKMTR